MVLVDLLFPMSYNVFPYYGYTMVFKSESLIVIITFCKSALALSIEWELLWDCALLRGESLSHPIVVNLLFILWWENVVSMWVSPKRIPNSSPLLASDVPILCLGDIPDPLNMS